jgi:hypothetical protein
MGKRSPRSVKKGPKFQSEVSSTGQPRRFNIAAKIADAHESVSRRGKKFDIGNSHNRMKIKRIDSTGNSHHLYSYPPKLIVPMRDNTTKTVLNPTEAKAASTFVTLVASHHRMESNLFHRQIFLAQRDHRVSVSFCLLLSASLFPIPYSLLPVPCNRGPQRRVHVAGVVYIPAITSIRGSVISSIVQRTPSRPSPESFTPP